MMSIMTTLGTVKRIDQSVLLKLLPFLTTVFFYFSLIQHTERSSLSSTVLKCLPILCLLFYVVTSSSDNSNKKRYQRRITFGLIFSLMGDILLNYDLFEAGMGSFGFAQVNYITAFGFTPLKLWIGVAIYLVGFLATSLFYGNLNAMIKLFLPFYAILLLTMCWRSLARIGGSHNYLHLLCGICSLLFVISDGIIAFDKFFSTIPAAQLYIMITYYLAQLGITLSIHGTLSTEMTPRRKYQ